jgi:hypothetical protein
MSRNTSSSAALLSSSTSSSSSKVSIWSRAVTAHSSWPDKEEFLDVIYWLRQVLGVILGLIWGSAALQVRPVDLDVPVA